MVLSNDGWHVNLRIMSQDLLLISTRLAIIYCRIDYASDFSESSAKTAMDSSHHAPVRRECVSVGSVCVLLEVNYSRPCAMVYSWIADQRDAHELLICQRTRRVTTLSRPPLESSRQGESDSVWSIFV